MRIEIISNSSIFTKNLGKKLSRVISKGDIVLFSGELGGGKTTFISGIAEGFDLKENLSSPSFTILNEYSIDNWRKFVHADLYRLENTGEINGIGLDDYLYDDISIVCIEWGDKIKDYIEKVSVINDFFEEIKTKLKFPNYFNNNWAYFLIPN